MVQNWGQEGLNLKVSRGAFNSVLTVSREWHFLSYWLGARSALWRVDSKAQNGSFVVEIDFLYKFSCIDPKSRVGITDFFWFIFREVKV